MREDTQTRTVSGAEAFERGRGFAEAMRTDEGVDPRDYLDVPEQEVEESSPIGDVYYTSWGYDQTNVEFWKIVEVSASGGSVKLQRIASVIADGKEYPVPHRELDEHGSEFTNGRTGWRRYNGPDSSIRVDRYGYIRYAFRYENRGKYSTRAAGLPGH